jgi:hypothetical protein
MESVESVPFAAAPLLMLKLNITNRTPEHVVHSILLRCQIQIEAPRRAYRPSEQEKLVELFGEPGRWQKTVRSMLWTHASATVASFTDQQSVELPVPCTYDFNVATAKYFHGLEEGDVPLLLLFSGTVFYAEGEAGLRVCQIPWSKETHFRLPLEVWKRMMEEHYPNSATLQLRRDVFNRLYRCRIAAGDSSWEQTLERLLGTAGVEERRG